MDKQSSISLQRGLPYLSLPSSSGDFVLLPKAFPEQWKGTLELLWVLTATSVCPSFLFISGRPTVQTWTSFPFSLFPAVQTLTNVRWCRTSALMASVSTPWAPSGASARLATPPTSAGQLVWVRGGCTRGLATPASSRPGAVGGALVYAASPKECWTCRGCCS